MKRWIHAVSDKQLNREKFSENIGDPEVFYALCDIFEPYDLVVDYYPGTEQYVIHPEEWPWPYKYCKCIVFGDAKVEKSDILVPETYLDGPNTTLPDYAIKQAVKAADRANRILQDYATGWPSSDEWPQGSRNSRFITQLVNYADNLMQEAEKGCGIERYFPYMLPVPSSLVEYRPIGEETAIWTVKYGKWLDMMSDLAKTSSSRDEFFNKYESYLESMLN